MAHPDLDTLFDFLMRFAQEMLSKHGEFYPFGAVIRKGGELVSVGAAGDSDHPKSQHLIDQLQESFQLQARERQIQACGICFDILTSLPGAETKTDAVQCRLETESGEAMSIVTPWTKSQAGVEFGTALGFKDERRVFRAEEPSGGV